MLDLIKNGDANLRRNFARYGAIKMPESMTYEIFDGLLDDSEDWVRLEAARSLQKYHEPAIQQLSSFRMSALINKGLCDMSVAVREEAAKAIGAAYVTDPERYPSILKAVIRSSCCDKMNTLTDGIKCLFMDDQRDKILERELDFSYVYRDRSYEDLYQAACSSPLDSVRLVAIAGARGKVFPHDPATGAEIARECSSGDAGEAVKAAAEDVLKMYNIDEYGQRRNSGCTADPVLNAPEYHPFGKHL